MPLMDVGTMGDRIKGRRICMGRSRKEMADYLLSSASYVEKIENDRVNPSTAAVKDISEALGVSLDYLVKGEGG